MSCFGDGVFMVLFTGWSVPRVAERWSMVFWFGSWCVGVVLIPGGLFGVLGSSDEFVICLLLGFEWL